MAKHWKSSTAAERKLSEQTDLIELIDSRIEWALEQLSQALTDELSKNELRKVVSP